MKLYTYIFSMLRITVHCYTAIFEIKLFKVQVPSNCFQISFRFSKISFKFRLVINFVKFPGKTVVKDSGLQHKTSLVYI